MAQQQEVPIGENLIEIRTLSDEEVVSDWAVGNKFRRTQLKNFSKRVLRPLKLSSYLIAMISADRRFREASRN